MRILQPFDNVKVSAGGGLLGLLVTTFCGQRDLLHCIGYLSTVSINGTRAKISTPQYNIHAVLASPYTASFLNLSLIAAKFHGGYLVRSAKASGGIGFPKGAILTECWSYSFSSEPVALSCVCINWTRSGELPSF